MSQPLIVVLPGIGGTLLAWPVAPDDVVWDARPGGLARLALRPERLALDEGALRARAHLRGS